jgi:hypothetical protein
VEIQREGGGMQEVTMIKDVFPAKLTMESSGARCPRNRPLATPSSRRLTLQTFCQCPRIFVPVATVHGNRRAGPYKTKYRLAFYSRVVPHKGDRSRHQPPLEYHNGEHLTLRVTD